MSEGVRSRTCTTLRDPSTLMIDLGARSLPFDNVLAALLLGFDRMPGLGETLSGLYSDSRHDLVEATRVALAMGTGP
ncbi:hypothetical protein ACVDG3_18480 [Meridianimarinicoccus sp. RP-17]|uniref:hypothetical protein n=1 Tax=Meridianimarinicoccus zhengii TaxID=2056810 RepID=UPI000DAB7A31|nr:hypothetical protein [Phycocomes zhengii]